MILKQLPVQRFLKKNTSTLADSPPKPNDSPSEEKSELIKVAEKARQHSQQLFNESQKLQEIIRGATTQFHKEIAVVGTKVDQLAQENREKIYKAMNTIRTESKLKKTSMTRTPTPQKLKFFTTGEVIIPVTLKASQLKKPKLSPQKKVQNPTDEKFKQTAASVEAKSQKIMELLEAAKKSLYNKQMQLSENKPINTHMVEFSKKTTNILKTTKKRVKSAVNIAKAKSQTILETVKKFAKNKPLTSQTLKKGGTKLIEKTKRIVSASLRKSRQSPKKAALPKVGKNPKESPVIAANKMKTDSMMTRPKLLKKEIGDSKRQMHQLTGKKTVRKTGSKLNK